MSSVAELWSSDARAPMGLARLAAANRAQVPVASRFLRVTMVVVILRLLIVYDSSLAPSRTNWLVCTESMQPSLPAVARSAQRIEPSHDVPDSHIPYFYVLRIF